MQIGFISAGGLLGLTIGALRGRFFKKLFYTTLGAGGATAICFPKEAEALGKELQVEAEKAGQIAYNFVQGGKNIFYDVKVSNKLMLGAAGATTICFPKEAQALRKDCKSKPRRPGKLRTTLCKGVKTYFMMLRCQIS